MTFVEKFKSNPSLGYALGVSATWAGAGSLIVGMAMVQNYGLIPFLLWAFGNIMACIVFGLVAHRYPYVRKVFTSDIAKLVIGFMCIFQLWVNMSGIHDSLLVINSSVALVTTYIVAIGFVLIFLKDAMLRNILTDGVGWRVVYVLIFALMVIAFICNGINVPSLGMDSEGLTQGFSKCIALIPGAFFYPCFWALFDYNEQNKDNVEPVDMQKCFVMGGLLFGLYLAFVLMLGITSFTPALEVLKGILLAIIALSSLTSFIYSINLSFGKKKGIFINGFAIVGWYFLIPMGVMGIWTMMANLRLVMVLTGFAIAIAWKLYDDRKAKKLNELEVFQQDLNE